MSVQVRRRVPIAAVALLLAVGLLVGGSPAESAGHPRVAARGATPTVRLSVMSQNIFYGGDDYDLKTGGFCPVPNGCPKALHRLAHIIKVSGADVVGVQEAERNTVRLARMLGWHASPRAHVISRFPILDPPNSRGLFTFIEPTPGRVVAVANTHLPSTPYGPYKVQKGWSRSRVMQLERGLRLPAIQPVLRLARRFEARGIPMFLTGDFNSPSYLDWTGAAAKARPKVPYPVVWPVSKALADAGFGDSYRDIHPNPVAYPGFTWSPGGPETRKHDFSDRIDWVLHAGPATTVDSRLIGERGDPQVDLAFPKPYPTDHRGVVSTFDVTPGKAPVLASPMHRRVVIGKPLRVRFHAHGVAGESIVLARRSAQSRVLQRVSTGPASPTDGVVSLETRGLAPGVYSIGVARAHSAATKGVATIWVYRKHSHSIVTTRPTYRVGQPIMVHWTRAPGDNLDWIGLFSCVDGNCGRPRDYLMYAYTHTQIDGSLHFRPDQWTGEGSQPWPLPAGTYIARLLVDDSYVSLGKSKPFHVVS